MQEFMIECIALFNETYQAAAGVSYFGFLFGFVGIGIGFAMFRMFWRGGRRL